jgi:1-phosphatidylinositol-3-phosphate 5-kinase
MIHGLVFTKNIAHKKMASQITNPQILLMKGSIEYQRRVNKFSSLEPQILQVRYKERSTNSPPWNLRYCR